MLIKFRVTFRTYIVHYNSDMSSIILINLFSCSPSPPPTSSSSASPSPPPAPGPTRPSCWHSGFKSPSKILKQYKIYKSFSWVFTDATNRKTTRVGILRLKGMNPFKKKKKEKKISVNYTMYVHGGNENLGKVWFY